MTFSLFCRGLLRNFKSQITTSLFSLKTHAYKRLVPKRKKTKFYLVEVDELDVRDDDEVVVVDEVEEVMSICYCCFFLEVCGRSLPMS